MLTVEGVPAATIERVWPRVLPWIERALAEGLGHLDSTDLRAALERRDMQLWIARREDAVVAALVTEIVAYPRRKVCRLVLMGGEDGEREAWLPWLPLLEAWARAEGCDLVEIYGRPGWARLVRHDRRRVVLERILSHPLEHNHT
jgi:hypothetical protein